MKRRNEIILLTAGFAAVFAATFMLLSGNVPSVRPYAVSVNSADEADSGLSPAPSASEAPFEFEGSPDPLKAEQEILNPESETYTDPETGESIAGTPASEFMTMPSFVNAGVLSCRLYNGGTLTVGELSEDGSELRLCPYFIPDSGGSFGIFISSDFLSLRYGSADALSVKDAEGVCIISGRTYDTLIPASSGAFLHSEGPLATADIPARFSVRFRVIRFSDYTVMGTAECVISAEGGCFSISGLSGTDVLETGEFGIEERHSLVSSAVDRILDPSEAPSVSTASEEQRGIMEGLATVEHCPLPYFPGLVSIDGSYLSAGSLRGMDIYAVNVPVTGTGGVTLYYVPELQMEGYSVGSVFFDSELRLTAAGYDFMYPFTEDTLYIPDSALEAYTAAREGLKYVP